MSRPALSCRSRLSPAPFGRTRAAGLAGALLAALVLCGHVGSPTVFFEGNAGPWPVRVIVRPPLVVPGLAEISIRLAKPGAAAVTAQPVVWNAGPGGAPPPDLAVRVPGDPDLWSAHLWLMTASSYGVRVAVRGRDGGAERAGEVMVPVAAVATERLGMKRGLGVTLALLGAFLVVGALSIVGAAVRESTLPPGELVDLGHRARGRQAIAAAALFLGLVLWGGKAWWDSVDAESRAGLYRPFHVRTSVAPREIQGTAAGRRLTLTIDDERWGAGEEGVPLMPDHGKLMHLFLLREPGLDAFAHLHPVPSRPGEQRRFEATLPPLLPPGTYRLYADVTHEDGFAQTLTDRVQVPPGPLAALDTSGDPDDSWRGGGEAAGPGASFDLGDNDVMAWRDPGPLTAGRDLELRFAVTGPGGSPATLEPYMGMASHAVIARDDGAVFIHLHPQGTVSMAAQEVFASRQGGKAGRTGMTMSHQPPPIGNLSDLTFPYGFPRSGRYRLWVQVKIEGQVRTGVFDAVVQP